MNRSLGYLFFESPADHDKNVSTTCGTLIGVTNETMHRGTMSIETTQTRSSMANDPCMPPPSKVLRRGSRELEIAVGQGEVCLSLPSQDWNSWIVKDGCYSSSGAVDEEYFASTHEANTTHFTTASPTTITTPTREGSSSSCSNLDPSTSEELDTQKATIQILNVQEQLESESKLPRFTDIIGHNAVKIRIEEVLLPMALPSSIADSILVGVRALPASILLFGPPGCGKTQLAKAIAGEADAAFLSAGPSDILSKFVGESEASIRSFFDKGR